MFVFYSLPQRNPDLLADQRTATALQAAKQALIAYALGADPNTAAKPGILPCPDRTGNDAIADTCTTQARRIARLPWNTLGIADLRDGANEPLWYAVSNSFRTSSTTTPVNSDTNGDYTIQDSSGNTVMTGVIAVIMAPGAALSGQSRTTLGSSGFSSTAYYNIANYLELNNATTSDALQTMDNDVSSSTFNDRVEVLTRDNFMTEVARYVTGFARSVLKTYYSTNGFLPNAAPYGSSTCNTTVYQGRIPLSGLSGTSTGHCTGPALVWPTWFANNNWDQLIFYAVAPNCTIKNNATCAASGGLTVTNLSSNARGVLIGTGRAWTGQSRPCTTASNCLEDAENTNGDTTFVRPARSNSNNDNLMVISP